jgi:hypothetical protein
MTTAELQAMEARLADDVRQSLDALSKVADLEDATVRDVAQEGLTLSYRCNLLTGIRKLLKGDADTLTRTERGLLGRNARIRPLLPPADDDDGGDGDE